MRNYRGSGKTLPYTASADKASGAPVLIGDVLGVLTGALKNGETGEALMEGVFDIAKLSTDTFVKGQIVYWDDGNSRLTETASTHKRVGYCTEDAGNGVATVPLKLAPL